MDKLNLGCGMDIKKGYINLDCVKLTGVDVKWDLNKYPYPFKNEQFREVRCIDVIEHLDDFTKTMKELYRITKKGGKIYIQVPHFTSPDNFIDPTHKKMFSSLTFDLFLKEHKRAYYFDFHFSKVSSKISFRKKVIFFWAYLVEPLVNISKGTKLFYELTILRSLFPAFNIEVTLEK